MNAPRVPRGALAKAVRQARADLRTYRGIVGIGIGHKRSKRYTANKRYGRTARVCVKIYVRTKRKKPPVGERIPKWIVVRWKNRSHRVPTDVESIGRPTLQNSPWLYAHLKGTPGFVVRHPTEPYRWLVSAGHVLKHSQGSVHIAAEALGSVNVDGTWFESSKHAGAFVDAGIARVSRAIALGPLRVPPWSEMSSASIVSSAEIQKMIDAKQPVYVRILGAKNRAIFRIASVIGHPMSLVEKVSPHAPTLYAMTSIKGYTEKGDSGAPVLLGNTSRIVGIHVVGQGDQSVNVWAFSAATAVSEIGIRLKHQLELTAP